jgi:hypothetical protein
MSVHDSQGLPASVLARFDREGIAYCHWKSNEHLDAAMAGETDLDLLIDPARLNDAYRVFSELGCRRGRTSAARNEPGLEDFFGVDRSNGRLVHFHVHWRLATGEKHLKRFRLPWERFILETRTRDEDSQAYVTGPAAEVVLLALRAALKLRWRDRARMRLRPGPKKDVEAELGWLVKSVDPAQVGSIARQWLDDDGALAVERFVAEGPTRARLLAVRRAALRIIGDQVTHRGPSAPTIRWWREVVWFQRGIARYYRPRPVLYGRGGSAGGLLVAVVGADGSGKSTLTGDLRRWFAPKFDVLPVYFGSGDGPASLLRSPLKLVRRSVLGGKAEVARKDAAIERHPQAMELGRMVWALTLAYEKHRKLRRAMLARTRGMLVITDRYPQIQVLGTNDGPLLAAWRGSPHLIRRRLAALEARPYERAARFPPDLVLRLHVDLATALARRPEHGEAFLARRIETVQRLQFPDARFGVVDLDATLPYDQVLDQAIQATFSRI